MKILAITAHPHYAATYCAGTLYKHAQRGDEVVVLSLTSGELMTNKVTPEELAKINRADAEKAAEIIGIKEMRYLDIPDATIQNDHETRLKINHAIREIQPDVLITHWPQDTHPDYRFTGEAAIDSAFFALLVSGTWAEKFDSHWTSKAYGFELPGLSLNFNPTLFVDISDVMDIKIQAIDVFQIHRDSNCGGDDEIFRSSITGANRRWGLEAGVYFAEAFGHLNIHEVHNKAVPYLIA